MNATPESWGPGGISEKSLIGIQILVVDDEPGLRVLFQKMLEAAGAKVQLAENGRYAIDLLAQHKVDLILTDLIMPEMEGLETIAQIRKLHPDLKIIAMSGGGRLSSGCYLPVAKSLGAHATLAKPFGKKLLINQVAELIQE